MRSGASPADVLAMAARSFHAAMSGIQPQPTESTASTEEQKEADLEHDDNASVVNPTDRPHNMNDFPKDSDHEQAGEADT